MVTMIDSFGSAHDAKVKQWRDWLQQGLLMSNEVIIVYFVLVTIHIFAK